MKFLSPFAVAFVLTAFGFQIGFGYKFCPIYWQKFGDYCYRYFGDKEAWASAAESCGTYYSNSGRAKLASIHSDDENDFVFDLFRSAAGNTPNTEVGAWIGLQKADGTWSWFDGESVGYQKWLPGQPDDAGGNEDCGHLLRRNTADDSIKTWNDLICTRVLPYICKMKPNDIPIGA